MHTIYAKNKTRTEISVYVQKTTVKMFTNCVNSLAHLKFFSFLYIFFCYFLQWSNVKKKPNKNENYDFKLCTDLDTLKKVFASHTLF